MNLVFHTVFSISNSTICAKKIRKDNKPLKYLVFGFIGNIIGHGIMDLIPHNYPLTITTDISVSCAIFLLSMIFVKREFITSVFFCFLGGALPDLIDKGIFRIVHLNNLKAFHWHEPVVINFFYKWYSSISHLFNMFNILVIIFSVCLLLLNRIFIFQHMLKFTKKSNEKQLLN